MPTVAYFYGIAVSMFFNDHNPPHFHARYGRARASWGYRTVKSSPTNGRRWQSAWFATGLWRGSTNWKKIGGGRKLIWNSNGSQVPMPRNEFPMVDVVRLKPVGDHRLWVRFADGSEGVRDFSDLLAKGGPMIEPLKSPDYFARAFVESGVPTWPNGFDIDPIHLYMELRDSGALCRAAEMAERQSAVRT